MGKKKVNLIEKFINDNGLDFLGSGSDLNGNCVILAGYACYLGIPNEDALGDILDAFDEDECIIPTDATIELYRVFRYALENNYSEYWKTEDAKKTYVF